MKKIYESGKGVCHIPKKLLLVMKLTAFLFVVFTMQVTATVYSQNKKLSLNMQGNSIKEVLQQIEAQSEYRFIYENEKVNLDTKVSIRVTDEVVENILKQLFGKDGVSYSITESNMILINPSDRQLKSIGNEPTNSQQQKTVSGKVTDSTGEGLPGVSVVVKGTTTGTITDIDGNYSLGNVPANVTMVFSFVGMRSQEIGVGNKTSINVRLEDETIGIEEVVAIGYGVQKKSVTTGAISSVKSDDIKGASITRAEQALQSKTAGVQVISGSGSPGAGMKIRIRGYSSNGSSDPLYIVDGLRTKDISSIDPNSISNMEVLKDAASSAIYGAEGGNGVVIITTKTGGKGGKSQINYEMQYSMQSLGHTPSVMNAQQYSTYMNEAGLISNAPTDINTNWVKESFESAPLVKHYLSFTGGNDKGSYLLSLSYLDQEGILKGSQDNYKRYTGMFNADYKLYSWLKVGSNVTFNHSIRNTIAENSEYQGVIASTIMLDPLTPVEYTGDVPAHVQALKASGKTLLTSPDGNYWGISKYLNGDNINPFVNRDRAKTVNYNSGFMGSFFSEISPVKGLTITSRVGLDASYFNPKTYRRVFYYNADMYNDYPRVEDLTAFRIFWQLENYANYTKKIDKHNFTLLAGMSSSESRIKVLSATGFPLSKDKESYADLSYITSNSNDVVTGNTVIDRKASYFGRLSYDYDGKYLFQAILRRDAAGLSILPKDTRWGVFPSVSAGWVVSNEDFFPKTFISNAKLRASWGENGSVSNLGNYQYDSTIASNYLYPSASGDYYTGSQPAQLSNKELKWETSVQTDFGIDLRALKDKLSFTVDYFYKKTTDLITTNTPPLEAGNAASPVNGGDVVNKGFEFELGYKGSINDFHYSINGNLATLHNKVTFLNPTITRLNGATVNSQVMTAFEQGQPIWYFYGYKTNGVDPQTGEAIFVDVNKDGAINANDKTYIGDAIPSLTYGCSINLDYKAFDFSLVGQGAYGNDVLMGMVRVDRPTANRFSLFYTDRWTPENTTASRPKAGVNSNYWNSDGLVFDASFFRIKQIQLGYTLPSSLMKSIKLSKFRIYVSLEDYFTFTKYPGMDPEATSAASFTYGSGDRDISVSNSQGIDRGFFPTAEKLMFGASITF